MNENAAISITGTQIADGEPEVTQLSVVGNLEKTEKGFVIEYVNYDEPSEFRTVISVNDDTMIMTKFGPVNTEMLFREGLRTTSDYYTPYGSFVIGIYTNLLEVYSNGNGISIRLEYNMDLNYGFAAVNKLDIKAEYTQTDGENKDVLIS